VASDITPESESVITLCGGRLGTPLAGRYGSLTLTAAGDYIYVVNHGDAAVQALAADDNLSESFSCTLSDGHGATRSVSVVVTIVGTNDMPAGLCKLALAAMDRGVASLPGATIGSLRGLAFVGIDASSLGGVAVTVNSASAATQGAWQYSTHSGGHWYPIGTVSDSAALILSVTTQMRFMPVAAYSGAPPSLTVHAVDDAIATYSGGAAGETRKTANIADPGNTGISGTANTIGVSVSSTATAVDEAPQQTAAAGTVRGVPRL
jgi:VCBS repeat-containing protein